MKHFHMMTSRRQVVMTLWRHDVSMAQSALRAAGISRTAKGGAKLPLDEAVLPLTLGKAKRGIDAWRGRDNGLSLARCTAPKPGFRLAGNSPESALPSMLSLPTSHAAR